MDSCLTARSLWPAGVLRSPPIDSFQQISQLRRRDRHRLVRIFLRNGQWPHKAASLQPLGEQTHALAIVPEHLDQSTTPAAEYEQVAIVRVALERLLHPH